MYAVQKVPFGLLAEKINVKNKSGVSLNLKKDKSIALLAVILTRMRFRASDFGQVAKTNLVSANRNGIRVQNRMRRWYSGRLFACVIKQLIFGHRKIQASVDYCYVWLGWPWTQASKPALTDSGLAAKRRAEALHVVLLLTEHPSPPR